MRPSDSKLLTFAVYRVWTWEAICAKIQQTLGRPHKLLIIGVHQDGQRFRWVPNQSHKTILVYCYYIGDEDVFNAEHLHWQTDLGLLPPGDHSAMPAPPDTAAVHHSPVPPQDNVQWPNHPVEPPIHYPHQGPQWMPAPDHHQPESLRLPPIRNPPDQSAWGMQSLPSLFAPKNPTT